MGTTTKSLIERRHHALASFLQPVAGTLSDEGIETFSNIAARDAFHDRMKSDNLMLVAEEDENLEGVPEIEEGRHVAVLSIRPRRQRSGIGRELISSALGPTRVETVTVSASLNSVTAYEAYGFERSGEETTVLLRLLKQCRTEAGLTQADFAKAFDRPQSFVSDIERGLRRLDLIQLRDICGIFGISLTAFVERFEDALKDL